MLVTLASLAAAAPLALPRPRGCFGQVPIALRGNQIIALQRNPGGAMDGGACLTHVGPAGEMACVEAASVPTEDALAAYWDQTWAPQLQAMNLDHPSGLWCAQPAEVPGWRARAIGGHVAIAAPGRALVVATAPSGLDDTSRGPLHWIIDTHATVTVTSGEPLTTGQFRPVGVAGTQDGAFMQTLPPALLREAHRAPHVCAGTLVSEPNPDSPPSTDRAIRLDRTDVRVRARPAADAPAVGVLQPGLVATLGDLSCAEVSVRIDGAPSRGPWVHVWVTQADGSMRDGWVAGPLLAHPPSLGAPAPLSRARQGACGSGVAVGVGPRQHLTWVTHQEEEIVCLETGSSDSQCVPVQGPFEARLAAAWTRERWAEQLTVAGVRLRDDARCDHDGWWVGDTWVRMLLVQQEGGADLLAVWPDGRTRRVAQELVDMESVDAVVSFPGSPNLWVLVGNQFRVWRAVRVPLASLKG